MTDNLFQKIVTNTEIVDTLSKYYDFEIVDPATNSNDYFFKADEEITVIAEDASGGVFALFHSRDDDSLPVVYISSEGQAGKVGRNFEEFLKIMIVCPYWRDLLKFSNDGQLSEMIKAQPFLVDDTLEDFPEIISVKDKVLSALSLNDVVNPVEMLHKSIVSEPRVSIFSLEDEKFESLFNSFVVTDNPLWKRKM
ncbi:hypothetical protein BKP35_00445 [Anaerobacillus arseniciselenatis]|uniref:Uncharacterized protein n=1 Tax=Anaerobacillus arseniciselenatis TaxID=85682 RepID=A0A1S2LSJ0_9BACI|nr:hypothetical protein [Anaerobacillus arseniciselenatis]OIJ15499.1 hypothetical protein BKP35_00445 [Anaerobacillus arseniciselenatis]